MELGAGFASLASTLVAIEYEQDAYYKSALVGTSYDAAGFLNTTAARPLPDLKAVFSVRSMNTTLYT